MESRNSKVVLLNKRDFKEKIYNYSVSKDWNYKGEMPAVIDFYADWCVSCKELEKYTFPDPAVRKELTRAITLQADVTAMDADDQALMQRFGIMGPPTIVFFNAAGTEQPAMRVVGFMKAEAFAAHLHKAFAAPAGS